MSSGRLWLATLIGLAGCTANLDLPEDVRIACTTDGDCPDGFVCTET